MPAHRPAATDDQPPASRRERVVSWLAVVAVALAALAAATTAPAQPREHVNITAGGPLRAGVYGRIELSGASPPALLSPRPVVASKALGPPQQGPLYLYVPAGQVRKWGTYCGRYDACDRPVYFVRMDDAPFKLGRWKQRSKLAAVEATALGPTSGAPF